MFKLATHKNPSTLIRSRTVTPSGVRKKQKGFSLVELLVVVAILAILAAIAIPLFLNQRSKAAQGAVQSDARNLATDITTTFTNLPRSADPNVALNGSTAPNATLSGSGTISVGGETLNVNLSPDVTITKTGNADPTVGAGLKITHAGVENWACVIPLPFSVAYAQASPFQQTCGVVVSEVGNLLSMNVATGTDALGTTTGWLTGGVAGGNPTSVDSFTGDAVYGQRSLLVSADTTLSTILAGTPRGPTGIPVVAGKTYTLQGSLKYNTGNRGWLFRALFWTASSVNAGNSVNTPTLYDWSGWETQTVEMTAPPTAEYVNVEVFTWNSGDISDSVISDNIGIWEGSGGVWQPPGVPIVQP